MTQEEKARAYDEALERARKMLNMILDNELLGFPDQIREIFPQLHESEDERIRKLLIWQVYRNIEDETNDLAQSVYDGIKGHDPDLEESIEDWKKCLAYLEKQKEQKPAWSEEDEKMLRTIISDGSRGVELDSKQISFLKSLRPHWKPSEEQMEAFKKHIEEFQARAEAAVGGWNNFDVMIRLYEQLKKL